MKISRAGIAALSGAALALLMGIPAHAQTIIATDQGWFSQTGSHTSTNNNYGIGLNSGTQVRNWFTFDLTGVNSLITSASIDLFMPANGYSSPDASETFQLTSTSTPIASFGPGYSAGATGQAIYNSLGTGTLFGSLDISAANANSTLTMNLNADALAYLNANLGQKVAFGGRMTTIVGSSNQILFAFTGGAGTTGSTSAGNGQVKLNVTQGPANLTPEVPAGVQAIPVLLAVGGMALYQRKKQKSLTQG